MVRQRLVVLCVLIFGASLTSASELEQSADSYTVKAAYLMNFARFVTWPEGSFQAEKSPLVIGILDTDPFQGALTAVLDGREIHGRPVHIKLVTGRDLTSKVHLLFIPETVRWVDHPWQRKVREGGILTIGESEETFVEGTVITLVQEGKRIKFRVNLDLATDSLLKIGSRMLHAAEKVQGQPNPSAQTVKTNNPEVRGE